LTKDEQLVMCGDGGDGGDGVGGGGGEKKQTATTNV
jgi:hypothetical protein